MKQIKMKGGLPVYEQQERPRGLRSRGNRAWLAVGVGFVVAIFAELLGADGFTPMVVFIVVAAVTNVLATPRS